MINSTSISSRVKNMIEQMVEVNGGKDIEGFIHSVFDYACNIQVSDKDLIGLISKEYGDNPYSISLDLPPGQTMKKLNMEQGMRVIINNKSIRSVAGHFYINLQGADSWEPGLPKEYNDLVDRNQLQSNLLEIMGTLLRKGNFLGIGPLIVDYPPIIKEFEINDFENSIKVNHYSSYISPRIKNLLYGIIKDDQVSIEKILTGIVGFGPGLTPSADDLLVGLLATLHYLGQYYKMEIKAISYLKKSLIDQGLTNQTTIVSRQMLKAAINGEFARSIKELSIAMIASKDRKEIERAVLAAINLGSTSGTDTLVGLLLGAYVIKKIKIKKEENYGSTCGSKKEHILRFGYINDSNKRIK